MQTSIVCVPHTFIHPSFASTANFYRETCTDGRRGGGGAKKTTKEKRWAHYSWGEGNECTSAVCKSL